MCRRTRGPLFRRPGEFFEGVEGLVGGRRVVDVIGASLGQANIYALDF